MVNTIFNMEAELKNKADRTLEIMTGKPVFYYVIQDSDGNTDPILRTSIGVVRHMKQDGVITAGSYDLWSNLAACSDMHQL